MKYSLEETLYSSVCRRNKRRQCISKLSRGAQKILLIGKEGRQVEDFTIS